MGHFVKSIPAISTGKEFNAEKMTPGDHRRHFIKRVCMARRRKQQLFGSFSEKYTCKESSVIFG